MSGYSGTPLWKKLGYNAGIVAFPVNSPSGYKALLGLPTDVDIDWTGRLGPSVSLIHHFTTSRSDLKAMLPVYRERMDKSAAVWISWPKKSSGVASDVTENVIREIALPLGFVDVKVCAVDDVWSGLKLVVRREQR